MMHQLRWLTVEPYATPRITNSTGLASFQSSLGGRRVLLHGVFFFFSLYGSMAWGCVSGEAVWEGVRLLRSPAVS